MKQKIISLSVIILLLAGCLSACSKQNGVASGITISDSQMFRNNNLGDDKSEIIEENLLTEEKTIADKTVYVYKNARVDETDAEILYMFDTSDKLESGIIYYYVDDLDKEYDVLLRRCDELFGDLHLYSDDESVHWRRDDRIVVIMKSAGEKNKLIYNVCTIEAY